jgi:hypothetical protein
VWLVMASWLASAPVGMSHRHPNAWRQAVMKPDQGDIDQLSVADLTREPERGYPITRPPSRFPRANFRR